MDLDFLRKREGPPADVLRARRQEQGSGDQAEQQLIDTMEARKRREEQADQMNASISAEHQRREAVLLELERAQARVLTDLRAQMPAEVLDAARSGDKKAAAAVEAALHSMAAGYREAANAASRLAVAGPGSLLALEAAGGPGRK